jgi:hypothetical protein
MTTLPIMLFDERKLTPSFGYIFDPKWLDPHESIVSILWKLARMNALSGHMITTQLAKTSIDPYEGVEACRSQVDMRRLDHTLGLQLKIVRASLIPDALQTISSPWLRYCKKCLCRGYHGVVHQMETVGRCPVHGSVLEVACGHCGSRTPYRLNAYLLDAPYRCGNCRSLYSSCMPSISTKRPLSKKARTAITRMRWNHTLYF